MTTTPSSAAELSLVKFSNDLQLTNLVSEFNKRVPLLNHYLTNGQLNKAWVMADALRNAAELIQFRLNDLIAARSQ